MTNIKGSTKIKLTCIYFNVLVCSELCNTIHYSIVTLSDEGKKSLDKTEM